MKNSIKVSKTDYEVFKSNSGVFSIVNKVTKKIIFGGDSANEDDYNEEYINDVYNSWDGTLTLRNEYRINNEN